MSDLDGLGLPSIKLLPFPLARLDIATGARIAYVECDKCLCLGNIYVNTETKLMDIGYCKGNQPPVFECKDVFGGTHEHTIVCAGIQEEHFHVKCLVCSHSFLMALPVSLHKIDSGTFGEKSGGSRG